MQVVVWMNLPSHHQSHFFSSLRKSGINLSVRYYDDISLNHERSAQGWSRPELHPQDKVVSAKLSSLETVSFWQSAIHVVPGYGHPFLRKLGAFLSKNECEWVHWSECSHPGIRWWGGYPRKHTYARLVSKYSLGAFAQGIMAERDFERWGIPSNKIAFLPYVTYENTSSSKEDQDLAMVLNGRQSFLYVGTQSHRKGIDIAINAFSSIDKTKRKNWAFVIVGKDLTNGKYFELVKRLALTDDVIFIPAVASEKVHAIMKCCDVFILPSRFDGWGVVLNEAAMAGLALIGSNCAGASHHLIEPGSNGFRFPKGDIHALRCAMLAYIRNPTLIKNHGKASLDIAADYTPDRNAQRFSATIESWRALSNKP